MKNELEIFEAMLDWGAEHPISAILIFVFGMSIVAFIIVTIGR